MPQGELGLSGPLGPLELTFAVSAGRGWAGLEAVRYRDQPPNEVFAAPSTHYAPLLLLHAPKAGGRNA
jgi:hypothetical protein